MTAENNSNTETSTEAPRVDSIGDILKEKRGNLNLTIEDICKSLNLRSKDIIALEANDITTISSHIYVPGLIISYAKLLKLDEKIITEKLKDLKPSNSNQQQHVLRGAEDHDLSPNKDLTVNSILIAILLMITLFSFYHSYEKRDNLITNQKLIKEMENVRTQE